MRTPLWAAAGLLLMWSFSARAAILAADEKGALAASATTAPVTTSDPDVSNTAITQGPGVGSANNWPDGIGTRDNVSGTLAAAISNDDYFTLTVTPGSGKSVDFTNFFVRLNYAAATSTGGRGALMTSETGFTDGDELATYSLTKTGGNNTDTFNTDLSGQSALQGKTSAVEFRLYFYDVGQIGSRWAIGNAFATDGADDLIVYGTTGTASAIPTLSEWGMIILLALLALVGGRRALKRSSMKPA